MDRELSDAFVAMTLALVTVAGLGLGYAIAGATAAGAVESYGANAPEVPETTIRLEQTGGSPCTPKDPKPLHRRKFKDVTWHIVNACQSAFRVKIDNFRAYGNDGTPADTKEDILNPAEPTTQSVAAGQTVDLKANVSKDAKKESFYKYRISIGTDGQNWPTTIDPDIDIWP